VHNYNLPPLVLPPTEEDQYAELDTAEIEFRGHRLQVQRQMITLLPKYCVSERLNKQLKSLDLDSEEDKTDVKAKVTQAYLEVATNVTSYCRALVSNSGEGRLFGCRVFLLCCLFEEKAIHRNHFVRLSVQYKNLNVGHNFAIS